MDVGEFLEGRALTGRQAAIIGFAFLTLIIVAAIFLIVFSDLFQNLVTLTKPY